MDVRERALDIVMTKDVSAEDIERAITEAVEEEREAGAQIADDVHEYSGGAGEEEIAARIRARGGRQ